MKTNKSLKIHIKSKPKPLFTIQSKKSQTDIKIKIEPNPSHQTSETPDYILVSGALLLFSI